MVISMLGEDDKMPEVKLQRLCRLNVRKFITKFWKCVWSKFEDENDF